MSKAILVMDMPDNCYKCPLNSYHFCSLTGSCVVNLMNSNCRPNWCPLKTPPDKYDKAYNDDSPLYHMSVGWNNCVDEVLGG